MGRPGAGRGLSPLQAPHLLPLVLVVVHLGAVGQPLVPGLLGECGGRVKPRWPAEGRAAARRGRGGRRTEIPGAAGEPGAGGAA